MGYPSLVENLGMLINSKTCKISVDVYIGKIRLNFEVLALGKTVLSVSITCLISILRLCE